jgi:hypothetical protein
MAVSRILSSDYSDVAIIYLPAPVLLVSAFLSSPPQQNWSWTGQTCVRPRATYPEINGPAVLLLFCLAPHGVFPATQITSRAVSSYLAFSPLPALCCQRTGGVFSVTLSVTATPNAFEATAPASSTRHVAVWCSDFPPADSRLPAIACHRHQFSCNTTKNNRSR